LLNDVRYASCSESFGFSDGPSSPPLFVALQVPLFHRLTTGESLLVFADVKIINHAVGLLDGKEDWQAMQLTSQLASRPAQVVMLYFWERALRSGLDSISSCPWTVLVL
jgi:hypothetical protein